MSSPATPNSNASIRGQRTPTRRKFNSKARSKLKN